MFCTHRCVSATAGVVVVGAAVVQSITGHRTAGFGVVGRNRPAHALSVQLACVYAAMEYHVVNYQRLCRRESYQGGVGVCLPWAPRGRIDEPIKTQRGVGLPLVVRRAERVRSPGLSRTLQDSPGLSRVPVPSVAVQRITSDVLWLRCRPPDSTIVLPTCKSRGRAQPASTAVSFDQLAPRLITSSLSKQLHGA